MTHRGEVRGGRGLALDVGDDAHRHALGRSGLPGESRRAPGVRLARAQLLAQRAERGDVGRVDPQALGIGQPDLPHLPALADDLVLVRGVAVDLHPGGDLPVLRLVLRGARAGAAVQAVAVGVVLHVVQDLLLLGVGEILALLHHLGDGRLLRGPRRLARELEPGLPGRVEDLEAAVGGVVEDDVAPPAGHRLHPEPAAIQVDLVVGAPPGGLLLHGDHGARREGGGEGGGEQRPEHGATKFHDDGLSSSAERLSVPEDDATALSAGTRTTP